MPQTVSIELKSTSWNPLESFWRLKQSTSLVLQQMFFGLCLELFYQASFWKWKTTNRGSTVMQKTTKNSSKGSVTNNMKSDSTNLVFLYTLLCFLISLPLWLLVEYTPNTSNQELVNSKNNSSLFNPDKEVRQRNSSKRIVFSLLLDSYLEFFVSLYKKRYFIPKPFLLTSFVI